jgi:2-(1,2-epoxy-1,2-dihydrophenyl)acetyl-CoA isomerase
MNNGPTPADSSETDPRPLLSETAEGILWITLNRPTRLNAITREMLSALAAALDAAARSDTLRVVVLTGSGRAFSASQDLDEAALLQGDAAAEVARSLHEHSHPVLKRLHKLPVPVIAAVNGIAAGAGANLALNCDLVIAARSASFQQAFTRIGLLPDCGGTWLLPRLVGLARAKALTLLAEPLSAEEALSWGLVARLAEDDDFLAATRALAAQLAAGPAMAYGLTKQALEAAFDNGFEAQLDLEASSQQEAADSDDFREGLAAFKEKRQARFGGR